MSINNKDNESHQIADSTPESPSTNNNRDQQEEDKPNWKEIFYCIIPILILGFLFLFFIKYGFFFLFDIIDIIETKQPIELAGRNSLLIAIVLAIKELGISLWRYLCKLGVEIEKLIKSYNNIKNTPNS